jgi:glucokinase
MSTPTQYALVYDIGGSHISAAVCSQPGFALHGLTRAPLPAPAPASASNHFSSASFGRLIQTLGETAARSASLEFSAIAGACLAMPGPFDYEQGISLMQHKLQSLYKVDLKSALSARFHWSPGQLRFVNDAAAFALGESGAGAAQGYARVLGLTLGTGIGASFVLRDAVSPYPVDPAAPASAHVSYHIADSREGNREGVPVGGELWNQPYNGATVEDFVSTRFLRHHYQALTGMEEEVTTIADTAQGDHPCPEISEAFPKLDPNDPYAAHCRARQAFQDFGRHLGLALNQHAAAFRPDVVVLGGGISRASALFLPATRKALTFPTELVLSTLMDEAPLAGAGVHWFSQHNQ